ncbi:hypothetical protein [Brazilian marseillevirus]|uniref:hypothetical protein n=1 Tax=Brazilian marseillevirus TaxID=1813599 RepID=UPI000783EBA0|nr:hypothetical protein A3303_gp019 [Brazilian marseillevirus]AMQ10527.1 hypothetical protein [Brazilian marseillevirus]
MSLTSEYEFDGDDFNGASFTYSDGILNLHFSGSRWELEETKEKFRELVSNLKEGKSTTIEFEGWNGCSVITAKPSQVSFCVSKYGGAGSGDIDFSLPLEKCVSAFENLC